MIFNFKCIIKIKILRLHSSFTILISPFLFFDPISNLHFSILNLDFQISSQNDYLFRSTSVVSFNNCLVWHYRQIVLFLILYHLVKMNTENNKGISTGP